MSFKFKSLGKSSKNAQRSAESPATDTGQVGSSSAHSTAASHPNTAHEVSSVSESSPKPSFKSRLKSLLKPSKGLVDSAGTQSLPELPLHLTAVAQQLPSEAQPELLEVQTSVNEGNRGVEVASVLVPSDLDAETDLPPSKAMATLKTAGNIFDQAVHAVHACADAFPPLKPVTGGLVHCIKVTKTVMGNHKEFQELVKQLEEKTRLIESYPTLGKGDIRGILTRTLRSIDTEVSHLNDKLDRGLPMRIIEVDQDKDALLELYRKIRSLFDVLSMEIKLRTLTATSTINEKFTIASLCPTGAALYNSRLKSTAARRSCTPGTRVDVLEEFRAFMQGDGKIYWMDGIAGTGKTTISYTICEQLEAEGRLGGNFFCSRLSSECRDIHNIVPTITYQLAQYSGDFRSNLLPILEQDSFAKDRDVRLQFKDLLEVPYQSSGATDPTRFPVIVIDALDESGAANADDGSMTEFLAALFDIAKSLPIKFFVTSRPEPKIKDNIPSNPTLTSIIFLHNIDKKIVGADITSYLVEAFQPLERNHRPTSDQIGRLTELAGGLFIYAATVVRYMAIRSSTVDSLGRLRKVLEATSVSATHDLDNLYKNVLAGACDDLEEDELAVLHRTLRTVLCAKEPMTIRMLTSILGFEDDEDTRRPLRRLGSVLHFHEPDGLVAPFHASFPDFMFDEKRSGQREDGKKANQSFHCDRISHASVLAEGCFRVMKSQLCFNICRLESSFIFDKDVPDLSTRIEASISAELLYASRFWGDHLVESRQSNTLDTHITDFLSKQFLFWMEVVNLCRVPFLGRMLQQVRRWMGEGEESREIVAKLVDAEKFLMRFAGTACKQSTPHIYISVLPFYHRNSFIYQTYWRRMQRLIEVKGKVLDTWESGEGGWRTEGNYRISALMFSPDGHRVACGFNNGAIHILDGFGGNAVIKFMEKHTEFVSSLVFSPDGHSLASLSKDGTVLIHISTLNVATSVTKIPSENHSAIAYSPDSSILVTGSSDGTIRRWVGATGEEIGGLCAESSRRVTCVAWSPDGKYIASASDDGMVHVWDLSQASPQARVIRANGVIHALTIGEGDLCGIPSSSKVQRWHITDYSLVSEVEECDGEHTAVFSRDGTHFATAKHWWNRDVVVDVKVWETKNSSQIAHFKARPVIALAISPDGRRVLSASEQTIQVWDTYSDQPRQSTPSRHIYSVAFFPDGHRIVQGGEDGLIRVWDIISGEMSPHPFMGHSGNVNSVAVSPNGGLIASASDDKTLRLWNAETGEAVGEPLTDYIFVRSVAFSPDGLNIASGSFDNTAHIWDVQSGREVGKLQGHTQSVWSVAYSPDGSRITTGSKDMTIRIWDAHSHQTVVGPLWGHTDSVNSVAFSPDGTSLVSGSSDETIRIWDVVSGRTVAGPFVSGSSDETIRIWDVYSGRTVAGPFEGLTNHVRMVAFSPNGGLIASCSTDCTVRLWDSSSGAPLAIFRGHNTWVPSISFSPDDHWLVSSGRTSRVWDLTKALHSPSPPPSTSDTPDNFPDGAQIDIKEDGWLYANGKPFFWFPPSFRIYLPYPGEPNPTVLTPLGSVSVDYHDCAIGMRWTECNASL